jgi:erythritol kinase
MYVMCQIQFRRLDVTKDLFIGVDVGTTAVKAAAYTKTGVQVVSARRSVQLHRPKDGFCELPMDQLWDSVAACLEEVASGIDKAQLRSIGVCGQGDGLWMLDAQMQPVRNAILWNDARASSYVQGWVDTGISDKISQASRTAIWPGTAGAALAWVRDNEPDAIARAQHILFAKDWIVYKLTGELGTDFSDATIPFLDLATDKYSSDVFTSLGLPDLSNKLKKPASATKTAGVLKADIGLPAVPVATGALDLAAMMTGLGLSTPGDMCLILGTTAVRSFIMAPEPFTKPPVAATVHHPFTQDWIRVLAPQSGASAFDWFAALHPNSFGGADAGEIASKINEIAKHVPPGANGVIFQPFLTGERAPFVAPDAAASFLGMRPSTTKADLARAVMEGTGLSLRHCLYSENTPAPERVVLTGGGARNTLWCQIVADIMGVTILTNEGEDHGLWGAALLGGATVGLDPLNAIRDETFVTYAPDPAAHETYNTLFETYLKTLDASRAIWAAMRTQP